MPDRSGGQATLDSVRAEDPPAAAGSVQAAG